MRPCLFAVSALALATTLASQNVLITSDQTIGPADTSITPSGSSQPVPLTSAQIVVNGATLTINGRHTVASLSIQAGGNVTHDPTFFWNYSTFGSDIVNGLSLTATGNVTVDAGGTINVNGRGDIAGQGLGQGSSGACGLAGANSASGGGYGGAGGASNVGLSNTGECFDGGHTHGSYEFPTDFGSGGGNPSQGGAGGGVIKIVAGGNLTIDGSITSNGESGSPASAASGGGSGGSIWLEGISIAISGTITATGGLGTDGAQSSGGSGGGGRIRIVTSQLTVAGSVSAVGGTENRAGGAGTVLLVENGLKTLNIDNAGTAAGTTGVATGGTTDFDEPVFVDSLNISGAARVSAKRLTQLRLRVTGDMFIEQGALVWVSGRGYLASQGSGGGDTGPCGLPGAVASAGGSHGGEGGRPCGLSAGTTYGSDTAPSAFGSGGGGSGSATYRGGEGGGAAEVIVGGTLFVDGSIHASGISSFRRAGGAGGSILLSASSVTGAGQVHARGGNGYSSLAATGGGGGGGRIAIYGTNNLTVVPSVAGGGVGPAGQTGSFFQDPTPFALPQPAGGGCAGSFGVPILSSSPTSPTSYVYTLSNIGTYPFAFLAFGFVNTAPYPIDLSLIGMSNCLLRHDIVVSETLIASGGQASYTLAVDPSAIGTVFSTGLISDIPGNPFGLVLSNAVSVTIQ